MKKLSYNAKAFFVLLVFIFMYSSVLNASEGVIILDNSSENSVSLISYTPDRIELNALSSEIAYTIVEQDGQLYAELAFENGSIYGDYGDPMLPVFYKLIAIPEGAEYEISYSAGRSFEIDILMETGADYVYPIQLPVPKSGEHDLPFQFNDKIYNDSTYFPKDFLHVHNEIRARGIRLLPVNIFPVKYNPVDGQLRVYTDMQIQINIINPDFVATHNNYKRYLSSYSHIYKISSIGLEKIKAMTNVKEPYYDGEGMLIITGDIFYDDLADFITWKEIKGYRVTTVKRSDIPGGTSNTGIKAFIQDAYDTWDIPPSHIILVGDVDQIPTFTGPNSYSASDQLYVFLDGDDYFPDAAISRISVLNTSQLNTYLNKLLYYEEFGNTDLSWMTDAALVAGEDFGSGHIAEGTFNYAVDNYLDPLNWDYDKLYRHTYDATKAQVIASMNAGKMIANYSAHCGPTTWAFRSGQYIENPDVHALTNQNMYFYAIGNCCSSADFDSTAECIAEAFIRADNAAIAYWGASNSSYWGEDDILAKKSYDGFFAEDIQLLSPNSDYSKVQLWNHYSGGGRSKTYMEYYVVFGDGTTFIPKVSPTEMAVNAPLFVASGSTSMNVSVTSAKAPVVNALVSAWMPSLNVRGIARTDQLGNTTVYFDEPLTIPGEFMLTVTHPNHINNTTIVTVGTSSDGLVTLDKDLYNCSAEVNIMLMDEDLANLGTYYVDVNSTTFPAGINVLLTETTFEGVFAGSFILNTDLPVSHGDIVTVEYYDADTGDGTGELKTDTAEIDCLGPEIYNIEIATLTGNSAVIEFTTNENAKAFVNYGIDEGNLDMVQDISTSFKTVHSGTISGLAPNTDYFFEIVATDIVDNQNTSSIYTFKTLNILTVGDGNDELTNAPLYCYYHDNRTQVIYLASDLSNTELLINSIAIDVTALPALTLNNWTIRMKHTDKDDYSGGQGFETDGWTIVYQDIETIASLGWVTFTFDEPYLYDGMQNLMVDFSFNNSTWQSPPGKARWTPTASSRTLYGYSDSNNGDPLDWSGTSSPTAYSTNHFLNIQLGLLSIEPDTDGTVEFDRDYYTCDSTVTVTVMDANVPGVSVTVNVSSTSDNTGIDAVLPEVAEGVFQGTINLGTDLAVGHNDTITAAYLDEDIGDGSSQVKTDTALADCLAPVISNIIISNIFGNSADFSFTTDEPATAKVRWGADCGNLNNEFIISNTYVTNHSGTVTGFTAQTEIFYRVQATDQATNTAQSDCNSFITANVISIGDGIEELDRAPFYTYYWKNRTSLIYLSNELGSGKIPREPLEFYSLSLDVSKIPLTVMHNFTIRLKHTDKTDFSANEGFETADWTVVYQNDEEILSLGWRTFYFQGGPFVYDGMSNLMVDISFYNTYYTPSSDIGRCYWTASATPRAIYGYADSSYGDPLDWTGTTDPTLTNTNHFINIQITLEESATPIPPSGLTAATITSTQINLSWNDNSTNEDGFGIQRKQGTDGTWDEINTVPADTASYEDADVLPGNTYFYRVYAFNANGNSDFSNEASANTITLADALDNHDLEWITYGDAEWFGQADEYHYGGSSAQSGPITHNQSTILETTAVGPGELSFYWMVSSEANYDYLAFFVNGVQQAAISGNVSWQQRSYTLPSGENTLIWEYSKDGSVNAGADTGWVDYVVYQPSAQGPDASISPEDIFFAPDNPLPGDIVTITARIRNIGLESVTSGTVSFYYSVIPNTDLQLITSESFSNIAPGDFTDAVIQWDTTGLEEMAYIVTVILSDILPFDDNPDNNQAFIEVPLPVELAYFTAQGIGNKANIEWMTYSEVDNLGWNIYRLNLKKMTPFFSYTPVKLNSAMIPGQGTSSVPHTYNWTDYIKPGGDYLYILESVDTWGNTEQWQTRLNWLM